MKTIFTLFSSLLLSASLIAAPVKTDARPKSTLTILSADRGDLRVVIDGRRFEPNDNYLRIQDIDNGKHMIKIYQEKSNGIFAIFGKRYEVVFNNAITMKPFTSVTLSVDRFGRTSVNETRSRGRFGRGGRDFGKNDDCNWDKDHDFQYGGGSYGDYDGGHDSKYDYPDYTSPGNLNVMSSNEFNRVLASIDREWFESNKMESASHIIQNSNFTSMQVKQILQLFSFENSKLELAKLAYRKTVDQRNYFLVSEELNFSSSKDQLARYIKSCE